MNPEDNDDNDGKDEDGSYTSESDSDESDLFDSNELDELLEQDLPEDFRRCPKRRKLMPQELKSLVGSSEVGANSNSNSNGESSSENQITDNQDSKLQDIDNLETGQIEPSSVDQQEEQEETLGLNSNNAESAEDGGEGENKEKYKEKVVMILEEKGKSKFDDLPGGWIQVRHISGMPIYLHRKTRVCTLSKPYRLGPGSARRHNMPLSAIPCLAYRKALEREEEDTKARNSEDSNKEILQNPTNIPNDQENVEPMDVDNHINDQENLSSVKENSETEMTISELNLDSIKSDDDLVENKTENNDEPPPTLSSSSCPFDETSSSSVLVVANDICPKESTVILSEEHIKKETDQEQEKTHCLQSIENEFHGATSEISDEDELEPGEIVDDLDDVPVCSNSMATLVSSKQIAIPNSNHTDTLKFTDDNELSAGTSKGAHNSSSNSSGGGNNNEFHIQGSETNIFAKCMKFSKFVAGQKSEDHKHGLSVTTKSLNTNTLNTTTALNGVVDSDSLIAAKNLIPKAQVETAEEALATNSVTAEELRDYCISLFKFKKVKCKKFKSWSDRRKHTKEEKKRLFQRPTLPDGVQLITFPVQRSAGDADSGRACKEYTMNPQGKSSVCILHEYVQHALRMQPSYEFKETQNAANPYAATVMINNINYGTGYGSSKKIAKAAAARATLEILIPKMKDVLKSNGPANNDAYHIGYFDQIEMDDPRITKMCASVSEPSPYALLLTCLQRNFGKESTSDIKFEMISTGNQANRFRMECGEHSVEVTASNKRDGKQLASQALLCQIHPHIKNFGSFLRLYGNNSIKSVKEKKQEEQQITTLQSKASANSPNYAILKKLKEEMLKLRSTPQFKNENANFENNNIESAKQTVESI